MKTQTVPNYDNLAKAADAAAILSAAELDQPASRYAVYLLLVGVQAGVNAPAAADNAIYCVDRIPTGAMTGTEAIAYCDGSSQKGVR